MAAWGHSVDLNGSWLRISGVACESFLNVTLFEGRVGTCLCNILLVNVQIRVIQEMVALLCGDGGGRTSNGLVSTVGSPPDLEQSVRQELSSEQSRGFTGCGNLS